MTVRYLDPEDGLDTNDGLSFANRKKTFASVTAAVAAGDVIRMIASPGPNSIGTATWTDNSRSITIPSGLVKLVSDCLVAWTVSTNVTQVAASLSRKAGATGVTGVNIAAGFTTGKIGYIALGSTLDLSAFQHVSFWYFMSAISPVGSLVLDLCSDTTGDVPVNTIPLDDGTTAPVAGFWQLMQKDFGVALSASIQSIALRAVSDPGTISNLVVQNIVAAKGRNATDHLSHISIIGKNTGGEPEWYPIVSFSDTTAVIGANRQSLENNNPSRPYRGTTESVTTYAMRCLVPNWTTTNNTGASLNGAAGNPITVSGGWDRSAMSTQSGVTWTSGRFLSSAAFTSQAARSYWSWEKLGFTAYPATGGVITGPGAFFTIQLEGVLGCDVPLGDPVNITTESIHTLSCKQVWGMSTSWQWPSGNETWSVNATLTRVHGHCGGAATVAYINDITLNDKVSVAVGKIDNNSGAGFSGTAAVRGYIENCVFANNTIADLAMLTTSHGCIAHRCTLGSTTKYSQTAARNGGELTISSEGGDPLVNTIVRRGFVAVSDATTRHTASGVSWKMTLQGGFAALSAAMPQDFKLADIACAAGSLVTITTWCRRDSASLTCGIRVRGGELSGVSATRQDMTAAVNTWEQRTLTFTPSQAGVISLYGYAYGALASVWFDDVEVTQA